jgi:hypothetical protein
MTEERRKLKKELDDFVESVPRQLIVDMDADKIKFPKEFLQEAGKRHLLGLRFPPEYGGRGLGWVDESLATGTISKLNAGLGCLYAMVSIVGEALNTFGTEAQKEKYLKPIIEGKMWAGEALTEPRGGSDFFGATTTARKEGGYYILNGQKRFIVGGEGADFLLVYAVTNPEGGPHDRLSPFIVERDMGIEVKHVYGLMAVRGTGTARVYFRDTRVPEENLLGEENAGSKIFYKMMVPERILYSPIGTRAILDIAARYAAKRKAFGMPIRNFEAVSFRIAEGVTKLDAVSAFAYAVAKTIDDGVGTAGYQRRLVSELKVFATQTCWEVANSALDTMGGIGYTNVYPIERAVREARLPMIWTGTNDVMKLVIQHEYYRELLGKKLEGRDIESDVPLSEEEAAEEKVYE